MKPQDLIAYYDALTSQLRLERRVEEVSEALKQAKYDLRSAKVAQVEYQGSIRSFLDRFSGRREETEETFRRRIRDMEAAANALGREKEALELRKKEGEEMLKALPSYETLRQSAEPKQWAVLEAVYCTEVLSPLLEENYQALLEYRRLLRGEYPVISVERQQEITSQPNVWAKKCIPWLHRLKEAREIQEVPFYLGSYYESPDDWLFGVAADHNRRDRLNDALDQTERLQKLINP